MFTVLPMMGGRRMMVLSLVVRAVMALMREMLCSPGSSVK